MSLPLPFDRSVCPILLNGVLGRPFSTASISLPTVLPSPSPSSLLPTVGPVRTTARRLFRGHCGSRLRHRSARSNLINSCKFNYWLTAPRLRVLYLPRSFVRARAHIPRLGTYLFFFLFPHCLSFSLSFSSRPLTAVPGEPRTNPSLGALSFLHDSSPTSVSRRNFAGNAIARKW